MTPEERQLLGGLFDRVREAGQNQQRDAEAEAFINNAVKAQPYAPYLLAQTVIVQEETMKGAVQKIEELEAKVRDLESRPAQQPAPAGFLGGLGRSMFGGGESPRANPAMGVTPGAMTRSGVPSTSGINVPPPPGGQQYGQPMGQQPMGQQPMGQPGPWQQAQQGGGGSSFLKGAMGAAAGVAGGMLLANAVGGMFRGGDTGNRGGGEGSSVSKDGAWGNESKSADNANWDNSSTPSGDDWGTSGNSASGGDSWDNASSASGDDWDSGDSGGDSGGGDE